MNPYENIFNNLVLELKNLTAVNPDFLLKITVTVISISLIVLINKLITKIISIKSRRQHDKYKWKKTFGYFSIFLTSLIIFKIWLGDVSSLMTMLGLVAAGLTITLKEVILNLAGWVFILWKDPFEWGDRIEIGDYTGDVVDIGMFRFILNEIGKWVEDGQSTGRILQVPNSLLLTTPLINTNQGINFIWNEVPFFLPQNSEWENAKELILRAAETYFETIEKKVNKELRSVKKRYLIHYRKINPTIYTKMKGDKVQLTLRYLCDPKKRRRSAHRITENILKAVKGREDIMFV